MRGRFVSGGQTGADQAGWRAARASRIATGGRMPEDFLTEAGPRPDFPGGTPPRAFAGPGKAVYRVTQGLAQPSEVAAWIEAELVLVLNVAGNRESTEPGSGERA